MAIEWRVLQEVEGGVTLTRDAASYTAAQAVVTDLREQYPRCTVTAQWRQVSEWSSDRSAFARADRVERGLEAPDGQVLCLTAEEAARELLPPAPRAPHARERG